MCRLRQGRSFDQCVDRLISSRTPHILHCQTARAEDGRRGACWISVCGPAMNEIARILTSENEEQLNLDQGTRQTNEVCFGSRRSCPERCGGFILPKWNPTNANPGLSSSMYINSPPFFPTPISLVLADFSPEKP
jgi:hypothetical protein